MQYIYYISLSDPSFSLKLSEILTPFNNSYEQQYNAVSEQKSTQKSSNIVTPTQCRTITEEISTLTLIKVTLGLKKYCYKVSGQLTLY